jgi:hypothetical protein
VRQGKKITTRGILVSAALYALAFTTVRIVFALTRGEALHEMIWIAPLVALAVFVVFTIGSLLLRALAVFRHRG